MIKYRLISLIILFRSSEDFYNNLYHRVLIMIEFEIDIKEAI